MCGYLTTRKDKPIMPVHSHQLPSPSQMRVCSPRKQRERAKFEIDLSPAELAAIQYDGTNETHQKTLSLIKPCSDRNLNCDERKQRKLSVRSLPFPPALSSRLKSPEEDEQAPWGKAPGT